MLAYTTDRLKGLFCFTVLLMITFISSAANAVASELNWSPCFTYLEEQFQCASIQLPLVHHATQVLGDLNIDEEELISVPLIRIPARDQNRKKASLFVNPGGPGGSGIDFVLNLGGVLYSSEVREVYDIVGFDPRGVSRTLPLRCFNSYMDYFDVVRGPEFPFTLLEQNHKLAQNQLFQAACRANAGPIIDNMSSADVARDLEYMRQAVGDEKLHFLGLSYGSYIGVTYANMYPDKVGKMLVDGVFDPQAWATGAGYEGMRVPTGVRLETAQGSSATLEEFFKQCDKAGPALCSFSPQAEVRFRTIATRLREAAEQKETTMGQPENNASLYPLSYNQFIASVLSFLYDSPSWSGFANYLLQVEAAVADPSPDLHSIAVTDRQVNLIEADKVESLLNQTLEAFPGVACADTDNPSLASQWLDAAVIESHRDPYFGQLWLWNESVCMDWPGTQRTRYTGPFNRYTVNPILVLNTRFDPATPYKGALSVRNHMANSRMVTVEGWGHTTLFLSSCADAIVADYLLENRIPNQDISCPQDLAVFENNDESLMKAQRLRATDKSDKNIRTSARDTLMSFLR